MKRIARLLLVCLLVAALAGCEKEPIQTEETTATADVGTTPSETEKETLTEETLEVVTVSLPESETEESESASVTTEGESETVTESQAATETEESETETVIENEPITLPVVIMGADLKAAADAYVAVGGDRFSKTELSEDRSYVSMYGQDGAREHFFIPYENGKVVGKYVVIKYRYGADNPTTPASKIEIFTSGTAEKPNPNCKFYAPVVTDGEWHVLILDLSRVQDPGMSDRVMSDANGNYTVKFFRLDPMNYPTTAADRFDLAYVAVSNSLANIYRYVGLTDAEAYLYNDRNAEPTLVDVADIPELDETDAPVEEEIEIDLFISESKADLAYRRGDGFKYVQYNNKKVALFEGACAYYEKKGYQKYCENTVGEMQSVTYTKGETVITLLFSGVTGDLGFTYGEGKLPKQVTAYTAVGETTVTQLDTRNEDGNGMAYIIRLADGSFILIDGGYAETTDAAYKKLVELNGGSEEDIHIRAWLLTHSHGDHFGNFKEFSGKYAGRVKLDAVLYAPTHKISGQDPYFVTQLPDHVKRFEGAALCSIAGGMVFTFADVELEVLLTAEQIYKNGDPGNYNESSVVFRIQNDSGSMVFFGDAGEHCAAWLCENYGEALKGDMAQASHHGLETGTIAVYDLIKPSTVWWPCAEFLLSQERGTYKQALLSAEYAEEHILHGYGDATRPLSYKPAVEHLSLMPRSAGLVTSSAQAVNVRLEDGVLKFDVPAGEAADPYIWFSLKRVSTESYNAIRIVVDAADLKGGNPELRITTANQSAGSFVGTKVESLKQQGAAEGRMTLIVYLGDREDYTRNISSIRLDLGNPGETVEIYSIDAFWIDVD